MARDGDMDGMPNALIEAMALAKPVVSTYVSGIPELIKNGCGILVPPEDSQALARALEEIFLMTPESRASMGKRGYQIVDREFNLRKEVKKIKHLFINSLQETYSKGA